MQFFILILIRRSYLKIELWSMLFQTIILGIEEKIEAGILFAESEKRDRAILRGKINDMTELMSDEELIKYIPSKEITLELK